MKKFFLILLLSTLCLSVTYSDYKGNGDLRQAINAALLEMFVDGSWQVIADAHTEMGSGLTHEAGITWAGVQSYPSLYDMNGQLKKTLDTGELVILNDGDYAPFYEGTTPEEWMDPTTDNVGFEVDVLKKVAEKIGTHYGTSVVAKFVYFPWSIANNTQVISEFSEIFTGLMGGYGQLAMGAHYATSFRSRFLHWTYAHVNEIDVAVKGTLRKASDVISSLSDLNQADYVLCAYQDDAVLESFTSLALPTFQYWFDYDDMLLDLQDAGGTCTHVLIGKIYFSNWLTTSGGSQSIAFESDGKAYTSFALRKDAEAYDEIDCTSNARLAQYKVSCGGY